MSEQREAPFAGEDPFLLVADWLELACETEPNDPNAIALSTVDADGLPNARIVLLKDIERDAFVFYTNYESKKAEELKASGKAAFAMHWKTQRRQIRVRGLVEQEDGAAADAYYASRSLKSRLGAWASDQSRPLESRAILEARLEDVTQRLGEDPPRPPHWGGFRIRPVEIEFWADGAHRLHNRFRWSRMSLADDWHVQRLHP